MSLHLNLSQRPNCLILLIRPYHGEYCSMSDRHLRLLWPQRWVTKLTLQASKIYDYVCLDDSVWKLKVCGSQWCLQRDKGKLYPRVSYGSNASRGPWVWELKLSVLIVWSYIQPDVIQFIEEFKDTPFHSQLHSFSLNPLQKTKKRL